MKQYIVLFFLQLLLINCSGQIRRVIKNDSCEKFIIEKGYDVGFVITTTTKKYVMYGNVDTTYSVNSKMISSFRLQDCQTGKNIVDKVCCFGEGDNSFCLPFNVQIVITDTIMNITYFGRLPYKENWELTDVPIYKQSFLFKKDSIYRISGECILKPKNISQEQHIGVVKDFEQLKNTGIINNPDTDSVGVLILKLFLCTIDGYSDCIEIYNNLEEMVPGSTRGFLGDIYYDWLGFYSLYIKKAPN